MRRQQGGRVDSLLFLYVRPRIEPSNRTLLCIAVTAAATPLGAGSVGDGGGVDDFIRGAKDGAAAAFVVGTDKKQIGLRGARGGGGRRWSVRARPAQ